MLPIQTKQKGATKMKDQTITIKAPITEHCTECDYEASNSFGSHRYWCPKCGEGRVERGRRRNKFVYAYKNTGKYNFCSNEEQTQYYIVIPNDNIYGFVLNEDDLDIDCPFELANQIHDILDRYIYTSKLEVIKKIVDLFSDEEYVLCQKMIRAEEAVLDAQEDLLKKMDAVTHIQDEMECYEESKK